MSEEAVPATALTDADAPDSPSEPARDRRHLAESGTAWRALTALGVVFGDLGTSPLYGFREAFAPGRGAGTSHEDVLGVLSLIIWSLLFVVTVKYALFIMRADNDGEGGILALLALAQRGRPGERKGIDRASVRRSRLLVLVGLFGAALLFGDGVITPAISVLSAIEGLATETPALGAYMVPIAFAILVIFFSLQHHGTGRMGRAFGPVMLVWFATIAALGTAALARHPEVLAAFSPLWGARFFAAHGWSGMRILGAMALVITGTEALFADLGHFGRTPIRVAWFVVVLPALLLSYLGQGAVVLGDPGAVEYPFFRLVTGAWRYPLVAIATAAAIIASQGLVSAAFSLARQAVQLDYSPRLKIVHTSAMLPGQIYVPVVSHALTVACLLVVLGFRSSAALSAAFGVAVTMTMVITTTLFLVVARSRWRWPVPLLLLVGAAFLLVDGAFATVNLLKVPHGGWLPLVIAVMVFFLMTTWHRGHRAVQREHAAHSMPMHRFLAEIDRRRPRRVPGTAVFLTSRANRASPALVEFVDHVRALPRRTILATIAPSRRPVLWRNRYVVRRYGRGIVTIVVRHGFMESPNLTEAVADLARRGIVEDAEDVTYFVERDILVRRPERRAWSWRTKLFVFMRRNARTPWEFFGLPAGRVVEFGSEVRL